MKRTISVLLSIVIIITVFSMAIPAAGAYTKYRSGDFVYTVKDDGTAWIEEYSGSDSILNIPSKLGGYSVSAIDRITYKDNTTLKDITIPNSVKKICISAFEKCQALENVTIGNAVESIGSSAFSGCAKLKSVTVPDSVKVIDNYAFTQCTSLKTVKIGKSVTAFGVMLFNGCTSLTSVTMSDSIPADISLGMFDGCSALKSIKIPSRCESIGTYAFRNCTSLSEIIIPDSVTLIDMGAFGGCFSAKSISIGKSVKTIGSDAFRNCSSVPSVYIPASVSRIYSGAFYDCRSLTKITVAANNPTYDSRDNCNAIINSSYDTIVVGCKTTVIPSSVTAIGELSFDGCTALKSITIPDTVTSIGDDAFRDCTSLTAVTIPDSVAFINDWTFYNCTALKQVTIGSSVKKICFQAFKNCSSLTSITIPKSVAMIESQAFSECTSLKTINIADTDLSINSGAFTSTAWEKSQKNGPIYLGKILYQYKGTCPETVTVKNGTLGIAGSAFSGCKTLKKVVIPDSVTNIDSYAFNECTALTSVTLPNSPGYILDRAFEDCTSLKSVTIPHPETYLGKCTFGYYYQGAIYKKDNDFTISGYSDSTAEEYATRNGFNFVSLGKTYTVVFKSNGYGSAPDDQKVVEGQKIVKPEDLTNAYMEFGGWYTDSSCTKAYHFSAPVKSDLTLYAKWSEKTFTVSFNSNGHGTAPVAQKIKLAGKVTEPSPPSAAGWTFGGWYKDAACTEQYEYWWNVVSDFTLYAKWTKAAVTTLATPKITKLENTAVGVKLTWDTINGAAKYRVFRKTGSGKWTILGDTTAVAYTDKAAKSGTKYSYTVRCISADSKSYTSSYDTAGKAITYIAAPKITKTENVTNGVKITWGKIAGAANYRVFVQTSKGWTKVGDTVSTSFLYQTSKSGMPFKFTVRCISKDGKSYASSFNSTGWKATFIATPAVPTLKNTKNGVQISWKKVTGAVKYRIFRKTGTGKWMKLADTAALKYVDKKSKKGVTYSYTIRCISKDAKSYTSAYNTVGRKIKCVR